MRRRRRDESGVIAIVVALIATMVIVPIAGLAVDLGMQRVSRRDMQSLADVVALDLSRQLDGKTTAAGWATKTPSLQTLANQSLARNGSSFGTGTQVTPVLGTLTAGSGLSTTFVALAANSTTVPNAVKVTATTTTKFSFVGGSGTATRTSIGRAASTACFRLGSYAARLSTSNSALFTTLLNGALGNLTVAAASYQGLASSSIKLAALATALNVGSVNSLATTNVSVSQLLVAAATVVGNNGDTANATLLNSIATKVGSLGTVNVGKVLNIGNGDGAAVAGSINALDLLSATAFLANGTNLLSVPSLGTSIGLTGTGLTSTVKLIEGLQEACGEVGASASTSQGAVSISGTLASVSTPSTLTGLALTAGRTALSTNLASATGTLTNVVCGAGTTASPTGIDVSVASQAVTLGALNQSLTLSGSITSSGLLGSLLGGLLGSIVSVQVSGSVAISASLPQSAATQTATLRVPNSPTSYASYVSVGSTSFNLNSWTVNTTPSLTLTAKNILGLNVTLSATQISTLTSNITTDLVTGVLNPLLTSVDSAVISPISALLGLEYGGADVYVLPTPSCTTPELAG